MQALTALEKFLEDHSVEEKVVSNERKPAKYKISYSKC